MGEATTEAGFCYIVTGEKHHAEALTSIASVRACMPHSPIALMSDQQVPPDVVDFVIPISARQPKGGDKVMRLSQSPFERTLFLDSDTVMIAPCPEVFTYLDRFDVMACLAPFRRASKWLTTGKQIEGVPDDFPELNGGVIAYRRNQAAKEFMSLWWEFYERDRMNWGDPRIRDQPSFIEAIYKSKAQLFVLPPEYNFRFNYPQQACGQVKILHGRLPADTTGNIKALGEFINQYDRPRVFDPRTGKMLI